MHHRVWETSTPVKPWQPLATYGLLGSMVLVYLLQNMTFSSSPALHQTLWTIAGDWPSRPWSVITSTFAHGGFSHLFFNGLMLFFFGPQLERLLGRRDLVLMFILSGAVSGILQAELSTAWGSGLPALGASGALMFLFGTLMVLYPNNKLLIYGIVPVRFWIMGIAYAALDVFGAFNPDNGIGNFAHLAGMAIGAAFGLGLRRTPKAAEPLQPRMFAMR